MKGSENAQFMSSDTELLEKAANNKLNSPETEEYQIQGSPFKLIKENDKWFAAWGKGKMTMDFDNAEEVTQWMEENYWNLLITVITMAMDSRDLYKIDQMMKNAKRQKEMDEIEKEYTLHGEIERLKKEEKLEEIKDEEAAKRGYKTYQ